MTQRKKIAVLGAGPMGLAAAYQLIKEGYQPVVFEADDRLGGMAACFDFEGLNIERYYHFHCTSDTGLFRILKELGLQDQLHWVETKMGYFIQNKIHPWGTPWALLTFPVLSLSSKFRYGFHAFLSTKRKNWKSLDQQEATTWIKKWIGLEAYNILWKNLFDYKFYNYADQISAAWIWSRIRRIGKSRYNIFKEKLGYIRGGSSTLLETLGQFIKEHGGQIHLNTPVTEVVIEDKRVKALKANGTFFPFDRVISTIPLPYVPHVMPGLPQDILEKFKSVRNIAVVCVIVKLRQRLTPNFWLNINDPDMDIPGLVEYTNLRPLDHHIVYIPFYMPGEYPKYKDSNEVFLDKAKSYLKRINPHLQDSDFLELKVSRYRFAQPVCGPGYLNHLPPMKLPVKGLFVADTSYYYPEDRGISESIDFGCFMARQAIEEV